MRIRNLAAAALIGVAAIGVSGCATSLPTKVTRYSVAIPQGQSFYVVPGPGVQPGLEFNSFASIVSQQLAARGFQQASSTASADMLVRVGYNVDQGKQEVYVDPLYDDPFYGGFYGRGWSRYGGFGRSPFYWGWNDPFFFGPGFGYRDSLRSYTVYGSQLNINIVRRVDNAPLFDGRALARSQTDEVAVLVPSLIEAMFTDFPGENGKTVKITIPGRKRAETATR
ncbi:MAG TPA: DUF4136 domain-containing protein [Sphingomicrobium sp.]